MKSAEDRRYLIFMIEPTPYVLGLIGAICKTIREPVDVLFIKENASQPWNLKLSDLNAGVLPSQLATAAIALWKKIRREKYRVIYSAGWGEPLMLFVIFLSWLYDKPLVIESDSQLPANEKLWKKVTKALFFPLLFKIPRMMLPFGSRQAMYFRAYGVPESKITVINYTSDVTTIGQRCRALSDAERSVLRASLGLLTSDIVYIFVGRLFDYKGIDILLTSFHELLSRHSNARLMIIGDGPEREKVLTATAENHAIKYLGRLSFTHVAEMLCIADILVVPSIIEPYGLVVHEGMAAGLPVIATESVGCVDDLINDRASGMIVRPNNSEDLSNAMHYLIEHTDARAKMADNAKVLIAEWTFDRSAAIIAAVWREIGN